MKEASRLLTLCAKVLDTLNSHEVFLVISDGEGARPSTSKMSENATISTERSILLCMRTLGFAKVCLEHIEFKAFEASPRHESNLLRTRLILWLPITQDLSIPRGQLNFTASDGVIQEENKSFGSVLVCWFSQFYFVSFHAEAISLYHASLHSRRSLSHHS